MSRSNAAQDPITDFMRQMLPQVMPQISSELMAQMEMAETRARLTAQQCRPQGAAVRGTGPRWEVAKIRDFVAEMRLIGHDVEMYEGKGWIRRGFAVRGEQPIIQKIVDFMNGAPATP